MSNKPSEGKWYLRSSNTITPTPDLSNPNTLDPRHGECIRSRDHIYFQYSSTRYMVGGRNTGNWDVYIRWKTHAWAFEIRSDYDIEGQTTTKPASPLDLTGCDWDTEWGCYYDRYPGFARGGHPRTQEWARSHYLTNGRREGRNCNCDWVVLTGCDWDTEWQCYYDRYPGFARGGHPRTQEWARSHYLTNGRREGRNCNC